MVRFRLLEWLDKLYHKSGHWLPLKWACDAYDRKLIEAGDV